jgi:predicted N-formylglutamate amidohydrolase
MIGKNQKGVMTALLREGEEHPAIVLNEMGRSPLVLICEHAANRMPLGLGDLGLSEADRQRHIAWDIGAEGVARILSKLLDAPLLLQRYSRLAYDCNRPPEAASAMPETSEIYAIPGNRNLSPEDRKFRITGIYRPFHHRLERLLDDRAAHGTMAIPVSIHSFTRLYNNKPRNFDIGFLFDRDNWLANFMIKAFPADKARLNEPYGPKDGVLHLMNLHAAPRGLKHVMVEIRNDLIETHKGQNIWANHLSIPLAQAASILAATLMKGNQP